MGIFNEVTASPIKDGDYFFYVIKSLLPMRSKILTL